MKRGEIYFFQLDPVKGSEISKTRPAVIVSNDHSNKYANTVTIVPLSSKVEKIFPFEVFLQKEKGVIEKDSKICAQHIRTVSKERVKSERIGKVSSVYMKKLEKALRIHLSFI